MTPKVENYLATHRLGTKFISIEGSERACINCSYYDPYFHENRGNVYGKVLTSSGYCLRGKGQRGALRQPCKDFEREEAGRK